MRVFRWPYLGFPFVASKIRDSIRKARACGTCIFHCTLGVALLDMRAYFLVATHDLMPPGGGREVWHSTLPPRRSQLAGTKLLPTCHITGCGRQDMARGEIVA